MDLFNDHSDPVASQPTQLIQHALALGPGSPEHSREWGPISRDQQEEGNASKDFSIDSMIPPARNSAPRYRLQELSVIQSQSQNGHSGHEPDFEEGSQKENATPASSSHENKRVESTVRIPGSSSPRAESTNLPVKGSSSELFHNGLNSLSASGAGKANVARAISFQPPTTTKGSQPLGQPSKSMPIGNRYYPRSPSPPSQDSFGGPVSQDPVKVYLASTKQFDVPLSYLGETPTQEVIHPDTYCEVNLPDVSEHSESFGAAMRGYEAQRASRAATSSSSRTGNVLVAATPSNSGESAGPSQNKDSVSFRQLNVDNASQESTQPFDFDQTASSFDRLLDQELADAPEPTPDPTQPNEPDTQVNVSVDVEPPTTHATMATPTTQRQQQQQQHGPMPIDWVTPAPNAAVVSSNPRSLLRMVHPHNEYRIAKLRQMHGDVEPPSYVTASAAGAQTQPSGVEETQPSHIEATPFKPPRQVQPALRQDIAPPRRANGNQYRRREADQEADDALDVVPDSEPLRAGPSVPTPSHARGPSRSPLKKPFRPLSPMSEHGSGELIPDSFEAAEPSEADEDDIPLAVKVGTKKAAGKAPVVPPSEENTRVLRKPRSAAAAAHVPAKPSPAPEREAGKRLPPSTKGKNPPRGKKSSKKEVAEIPSSAPDQDLQDHALSSRKPSTASSATSRISSSKKQKGKAPAPAPAPPRARSMSTTTTAVAKAAISKKRPLNSETESSEEWSHQPTEDDRIPLPSAEKEDEEETEPADENDPDDEMEVDSTLPPPPKSGPSRKRRRVEEVKPPRGMSKASTSTRSKQSETPAPATRSVKRLRSGMSSTRALAHEPATRVFALWKQDGHYYSGTVYSQGPRNKYLIKFDDGTDDEVELKNMRRCELVIGDNVILNQENIRGNVSAITQMESEGLVQVEVDDGAEVEFFEVELKEIRIANRSLQNQWKTRMLTAGTIVTIVRPKLLADTTPSKQSLMSTVSAKAQRELAKTGFVVTLSPKNSNPEQTKDNMMLAIKQHGGLVIDDWSSVFAMEGKHSQSNKRWVATPDDFRWKKETNVDRVFLLSDDANQKPKFLLALALGIPCLSFEWLTKPKTFSSDWQPFLLSAGYSDTLGARISQLVDLDWGNCIEHLTDIMANRVAPKLFSEKTVLCIGADFVPLPPQRSRKNLSEAERSREASRVVPWIILCMGASKVEAVTDAKQVSASQMQSFDYIIVKERGDVGRVDLGDNVEVGHVNWVKECLISSRMVPLEWS